MSNDKFSDYNSRVRQSLKIQESESAPFICAPLLNTFYSASYAMESAERNEKITAKKVRADIKKNLLKQMGYLDHIFKKAETSQHRNKIIAAGLRGLFQVVRERYKDNKSHMWNGHHAMQEMAANALIKVDQAGYIPKKTG